MAIPAAIITGTIVYIALAILGAVVGLALKCFGKLDTMNHKSVLARIAKHAHKLIMYATGPIKCLLLLLQLECGLCGSALGCISGIRLLLQFTNRH